MRTTNLIVTLTASLISATALASDLATEQYPSINNADTVNTATGEQGAREVVIDKNFQSLEIEPVDRPASDPATRAYTGDRPGGAGTDEPAERPTSPFGDLDGDGVVGAGDLLALMNQFGACEAQLGLSCSGDLNRDGLVDQQDVYELLRAWSA